MDVAVHAIYLTEAYHGRPVDSVSAEVRYDSTGLDVAGYCRFGLGSGVGLLGVAWGQGGASLSIMGSEGHISFVFDEHMGYYGVPARAVRLFPASGPSRSWYMPFVTAVLHRRSCSRTSPGRSKVAVSATRLPARTPVVPSRSCSPPTGRRRPRRSSTLPLPQDELYRDGLAALHSQAPRRAARSSKRRGESCFTRTPGPR